MLRRLPNSSTPAKECDDKTSDMDYKYINQLLERYWAAETTLEEEEILRAFFSQKDIPAELEPYRALFVYQHVEKQADVLVEAFDAKMLEMIGQEERVVKARVVTLGQRLMPLFRAAAVVAIILTLGNAAQVPFQNVANGENIAGMESTTGVSVAVKTDTAIIDTLQQSNLKEIPTVVMPISLEADVPLSTE